MFSFTNDIERWEADTSKRLHICLGKYKNPKIKGLVLKMFYASRKPEHTITYDQINGGQIITLCYNYSFISLCARTHAQSGKWMFYKEGFRGKIPIEATVDKYVAKDREEARIRKV